MLGPSGSGKTTTLRMIAGFELPTSGRILLHGHDVTTVPPFDRDVNTVFQDYALFPHMTVGDNVGYGLVVRKVPRAERVERVSRRRCGWSASRATTSQAQPAVGRAAPARRPRARAGQPAARAAARRAARGARPQAPRGDADRAQGHPAAGRDHVHLRDPRPGGGAHDERPAGGLQQRPDRAGRCARPRSTSGRRRDSWPASSARRTCSGAMSAHGHRRVAPGRSRSDRRRSTSREPDAPVAEDETAALGTIREVVYLGPDTRYIVALDAGASLRRDAAEPGDDLDRGARPARQGCPPRVEAAAPAPHRGWGVRRRVP